MFVCICTTCSWACCWVGVTVGVGVYALYTYTYLWVNIDLPANAHAMAYNSAIERRSRIQARLLVLFLLLSFSRAVMSCSVQAYRRTALYLVYALA